MTIPDNKWGEDDPEYVDVSDDPEIEEELFKTSQERGLSPKDMFDKVFAAKYAKWLESQG